MAEWRGGITIVVLNAEEEKNSSFIRSSNSGSQESKAVTNREFIASVEKHLDGIEHYFCYLKPNEPLGVDVSQMILFDAAGKEVSFRSIQGRNFFTLRVVDGCYSSYSDFTITKNDKEWSTYTSDPLLAPIQLMILKRERFQNILNTWIKNGGYQSYNSELKQGEMVYFNDLQIKNLREFQKNGLDQNGKLIGPDDELKELLQEIVNGKRLYQVLLVERLLPYEKQKGKKRHLVNYRHYYYLDTSIPGFKRVDNAMEALIRLMNQRYFDFIE